MLLNEIKAPVDNHLKVFESRFRDAMNSDLPLLNKVTRYIVKRKGKQIRPLFVFFSAQLFGEISERTYRAASLIELLHTATLIHDDVVDDSNERRGFFSLNALWKNKIAVLVGDYLLSKGLLLSLDNDDFSLLKTVSESVKEMSEGELLQVEKARRLNVDEHVYFEIIRKKTASLITSCMTCGALSTGASAEDLALIKQVGEKTGIAFQIKDDILDFEKGYAKGKPSGVDIRDQKLTLPLIYLLKNATFQERRRMINTVKNHNQHPDRVEELIQMVFDRGGIDYASRHMHKHKEEAIKLLAGLPAVPARDSLEQLIEFTVNRDR